MTQSEPHDFETDSAQPVRLSARRILIQGVRWAISGAVAVYKILIPISFLTMLLQYSGLLERLDNILGPAMGLLHLPARAVMPLAAGLLTGTYGGVASMAVLGFAPRELALISVFLLISHNMIQESAVQGLAGFHPLKAALLRLAASVIVVWVLGSAWADDGSAISLLNPVSGPGGMSFVDHLVIWVGQTIRLCIKIMVILMGIMTALTWMKSRDVSRRVVEFLTPVLKVMGLGKREGLLWLTAVLFGVTYGSAVIIEETRRGDLTRAELERLHLSIGINHAMIEDPAMFLSLGVHPFWLWVPRLAAAMLAVHLLRLIRRIFSK